MKSVVIIALLFMQCYKCFAVSVCDICTCGYENDNEDYLGENIDCSFKTQDILESNYTLPNTVRSLDLSSSNLVTILDSRLLRSETLLELYLNRNSITDIVGTPFDLPELKILDLSFNNLTYIDADVFKNIKKLEYLNVANNKLATVSSLAFHQLNNLKEVILDFNILGPSIMDLKGSFGLLNKIQKLSIRGIGLRNIPDKFFADLYDIRQLVVSDNHLEEIFEFPTTLEYLDLSNNPIRAIAEEDFVNVPGLRELKLNNLQIMEVPDYVFAPLRSLRSLELERNRNLTYFSRLAFGREVLEDADDFNLEKLSVRASRLSKLDRDLSKPFGRLFHLDLQGNPWICDCDILWLKQFQMEPKDYDHIRCAYPRSLYNSRIFELRDKYFRCPNAQRLIGVAISVTTLAIAMSAITVWILKCIPRKNSENYNMFGPYVTYTTIGNTT
ncbi:leucine-rich repeat-containing protein 38-like [Achroia grisella]|uniref:leucine-rich repeat-containing protein 38-like n=1 Tax=Achroia grisella TaxID=688607 RepID=UPI0027D2DE78|nr:leucine-rich repeat-containing protein 38-like [Achroia grisella]